MTKSTRSARGMYSSVRRCCRWRTTFVPAHPSCRIRGEGGSSSSSSSTGQQPNGSWQCLRECKHQTGRLHEGATWGIDNVDLPQELGREEALIHPVGVLLRALRAPLRPAKDADLVGGWKDSFCQEPAPPTKRTIIKLEALPALESGNMMHRRAPQQKGTAAHALLPKNSVDEGRLPAVELPHDHEQELVVQILDGVLQKDNLFDVWAHLNRDRQRASYITPQGAQTPGGTRSSQPQVATGGRRSSSSSSRGRGAHVTLETAMHTSFRSATTSSSTAFS